MQKKLLTLVGSGEGNPVLVDRNRRETFPVCLFMFLNLNNVRVLAVHKVKFK